VKCRENRKEEDRLVVPVTQTRTGNGMTTTVFSGEL
jgi:hypothetical protein